MNLGIVCQKSGDWRQAAECYSEAHKIYLQVGDQLRLSVVTIGLGNIARLERRFDEAERLLAEARARARDAAAPGARSLAIEFMGELNHDRGRVRRGARAGYDEALKLAEPIAPRGRSGRGARAPARRRAVRARPPRRRGSRAATARRRLADAPQDRLEQAITIRVAGSIAWKRGRSRRGVRVLAALDVSARGVPRALTSSGALFLEMGRATEDATRARRYFYRAIAAFAVAPDLVLARAGGPRAAAAPVHRRRSDAAEPSGSLLGRRLRAPSLVACSNAMRRVETLARRAAAHRAVGAHHRRDRHRQGAGRAARSTRCRRALARPFLAVNCGALRADLALSQLFGHRKGAFTGAHAEGIGLVEAAHGGTPVPRRGRRAAARRPGDAAALPRERRVPAARRDPGAARGRPDDRGHQPRAARRRGREAVPPRPAVPAQRDRDPRCPRCASAARTSFRSRRHFLAFYGGIGGSATRARTPSRCCASYAVARQRARARERDEARGRAARRATAESTPWRCCRSSIIRHRCGRPSPQRPAEHRRSARPSWPHTSEARRQQEPRRRHPGCEPQDALRAPQATPPRASLAPNVYSHETPSPRARAARPLVLALASWARRLARI